MRQRKKINANRRNIVPKYPLKIYVESKRKM